MNLKNLLEEHGFPSPAIERITSSGIKELYPPQAEAVRKGLLAKKNLLMAVPTAAGKTLMAELCMVKSILMDNGRCLYIAPLKALASEKYNDFKEKYAPLGIEVGLAIGDADSPAARLDRYKILVATAEKVDSLLRSRAQGLVNSLSVAVLDEIHFINDGSRGPTLEILTARLRQLNPQIQVLALSATISNADDLADWLQAGLVASSWRPIPLKEGVYFDERIQFHRYGTRIIREESPDDLSKLTLDTLRGKGQVLIFVNSRRSTQAVARQIGPDVAGILSAEERKHLLDLSKKIAGSQADATNICRKLADSVVQGVAFHHAGLRPDQRELVEKNFKGNLIKVIACTPTLAAGVNLPARRAIVRDCKRYENGIGQAYIPVSEYKQCAGRAGRPQYDDFGEAVLVAKSHSEALTLLERYVQASPEPIISKLGKETALRIHVLSSIAGGYVHDVKSMLEFIQHTFLYHQKLTPNLLGLIGEIFDFLHKEQFIEKSSSTALTTGGYRFFATPLGSLTSRLYIDPASAITLRSGLTAAQKKGTFSAVGILHLVTCCPDGPVLSTGKKDAEDLENFASRFREEFILTPENWPDLPIGSRREDDYYAYASTLKTTSCILRWIEEEKEELICEQFGIGPGDIYRHMEGVQWLLYAAGNIAHLFHQKSLTSQLQNLRTRVRYGIKEELLELTQLKGVGRVRARILFEKGFKRLSDFRSASVDQLSQIKPIGRTLAQDILAQIASTSSHRTTATLQN
ncbi:MAG: DEAD/DEAH box helicase [Candidatus Omnitrophica bacterium]|nr:DEAD/DEAH box helicase [Candidatus Omnitrophota bacterium]